MSGNDPLDNDDQKAFRPPQDHTNNDASSYYTFTSASKGDYEHSTDLITSLAIGELVFFIRISVLIEKHPIL